MFDDRQTLPLFPFFVWLFSIESNQAEEINKNAIASIHQMRSAQPDARPGDHWQSRTDLQTLPEFKQLCDAMDTASREVLEKQCVDYSEFIITGCWVNIRPPGSSHPAHTHPNNYLSGTYYVQTPQGGDVIAFNDPRIITNIIAPPITQHTEYNARTVTVPVRAGMLVMFPAWLPHFVPPNQGDTERISISFDIMFTSFAEEMGKPKWKFDPKPASK